MDNLFRIFSPDFKLDDMDVLSAYEAVSGVQSSTVIYRKAKISYVVFFIFYMHSLCLVHIVCQGIRLRSAIGVRLIFPQM